MTWEELQSDKEDRRKTPYISKEYGEILIELRSDLKNYVKHFECHLVDCKTERANLSKRVAFSEKAIWLGIGGLGVLQLIFRLFK